MQTSLPNQQNSTRIIPRDRHAALFALINKVRMLNGWSTKTAGELDATIRTWDEVLSNYRIPIEYYGELYKRAFDVRQIALRNGKEPPPFDATLIVSGWTGENGLEAEIYRKSVREGRTLASHASSDCDLCFGSGMEIVKGKGARKCPNCRPNVDFDI